MKRAETQDGTALGRRLRALRDETGLSRRLVARHVGMSDVTLMLIESGQTHDPSFTFVVRLARFYGVSIETLADLVEEESVAR